MSKPDVDAGRCSVDRLVRRYSGCNGGGFYWVRDDLENKLIAQCTDIYKAAMIVEALNEYEKKQNALGD